MSKSSWAMIKPGTVIQGYTWDTKGQVHVLTDDEVKHRYSLEYGLYGENYWSIIYKGRHWFIREGKSAFTEIKIPPMKKEFVTLAVKGSEWEFDRDWTFSGWVDHGETQHTIPAGTRVKIIDNKMRLAWYTPQEKCIVAEVTPGLEVFAASNYIGGRTIKGAFIPAKEASSYLKLVTAGKTKTYWKMEDSEGNAWVDKRFATLGNLKSSLRVRFALVKDTPDADEDERIPEWVQFDDYERPDPSKGVFAVNYDHATDQEIGREDMSKFLVVSFLKA